MGTRERRINAFRLRNRGLERVLGSLEALVMEVMWEASGPMTIRDVTDRLQRKQPFAFTTVMTVMNRLVQKRLLVRSGSKGSYTYRPAVSRDAFVRDLTVHVTTGLVRDFGGLAVSQFVEALAEEDPAALAQLERALRLRRSGHERR